jgi:FMN phosphatase YigB (HAD superfamily)
MIKAYVFDQDGTLYPKNSPLSYALRQRTKQWISESLGLTRERVDELYVELQKRYSHPYHGFLSLGLKPEEYLAEVFEKVNPSDFFGSNSTLITLLKQITFPKYVVSLASYNYSIRLQRSLGIDKLLTGFFSVIDFPPDYSKLDAYALIRKTNNLEAKEILVIGDNFDLDIKPALENCYQALLVTMVNERVCETIPDIYAISPK